MEHEVPKLEAQSNFTKTSGIIYELDQNAEIASRTKSKVFVFANIGRNLRYILNEGQKISFAKLMKEKISKIDSMAISVSSLPKFFRFITDFNFGDLKVTDVMVETQLKSKAHEEIAITFAEGGDPVKDICYMIKSSLGRVFTEIRLEDLDNLQQFTDRVFGRVSEMEIKHPFLDLEKTSVQYKIPEDIEQAFEEIQKEKIEQKKAKARADREQEEIEQAQRIEQLKNKFDMEIKEYQLDRLGIENNEIRLLMTDPDKRAQYLDDIYTFQMNKLRAQTELVIESLKKKQELILRYFEKSSDVMDHKEMEKILNLIDQSIMSFSGESVLGKIVKEKMPEYEQLLNDSKKENQLSTKRKKTRTQKTAKQDNMETES